MLRLEVKPNRWNCLATATAMALDIPTTKFFELAGHDGSDVAFPWLPEPACRRSHHIQEAVHVARQLGYSMSPFELFPQTLCAAKPTTRLDGKCDTNVPVVQIRYGNHERLHHNWDVFKDLIDCGRGIIECTTKQLGGHAVAYDNNYIFDPDGRTFHYSREACEELGLYTKCLWQVTKW